MAIISPSQLGLATFNLSSLADIASKKRAENQNRADWNDILNYRQVANNQNNPQSARDQARMAELSLLGRFDPKTALAEVYPQSAGRGSSLGAERLALKRSPEAQAAFKKYNDGITALYNAKTANKDEQSSDTQAAYQMISDGATEYYNIVGEVLRIPTYSSITNADAEAAKATTAIAKSKREEYAIETDKSKQKQLADDLISQEVEKFVAYKKKFVEGLQTITKAVSLFNSMGSNTSPAALFAAVKLLSNLIEPGLSVTEGEVRGYSGDNSVSDLLATIRQAINVVKTAIGQDVDAVSTSDLEQAAKRVNEATLTNVRGLFNAMSGKAVSAQRNAVNAGINGILQSVGQRLNTIYGNTITQEDIQSLKQTAGTRLNAYLNVGDVSVPTVESNTSSTDGATDGKTNPPPKTNPNPTPTSSSNGSSSSSTVDIYTSKIGRKL